MGVEVGFRDGFATCNYEARGLVRIVPRVYTWLEKGRPERAFVFIHSCDIHCPYSSRDPFDSAFCEFHRQHLKGKCEELPLMKISLTENDRHAISAHYDGGIRSSDAYVRELLKRLCEWNLYEEELIVVTSDHSEALGGHDQSGHGACTWSTFWYL